MDRSRVLYWMVGVVGIPLERVNMLAQLVRDKTDKWLDALSERVDHDEMRVLPKTSLHIKKWVERPVNLHDTTPVPIMWHLPEAYDEDHWLYTFAVRDGAATTEGFVIAPQRAFSRQHMISETTEARVRLNTNGSADIEYILIDDCGYRPQPIKNHPRLSK